MEQQSILSVQCLPLMTTGNRGSKRAYLHTIWPRALCFHLKAIANEYFEQMLLLTTYLHGWQFTVPQIFLLSAIQEISYFKSITPYGILFSIFVLWYTCCLVSMKKYIRTTISYEWNTWKTLSLMHFCSQDQAASVYTKRQSNRAYWLPTRLTLKLLFKNITSSFIFLRSKPNYNTGLCFFIASPHESMNMKHKLSNKTRHNSLKVIPIYVKIITPQHFVCAPLTVQKLPHSIVILQIKANSAILSYFSGLSTIFESFKPSKDNTADSTHGK